MRRREFIRLITGAAVSWPLATRAQQPDRMRLIGVLMGFAESDPDARSWLEAFRGALAKLGWREDNNLRIELSWATGDTDKIGTLAKELVDLRPDAILGRCRSARRPLFKEDEIASQILGPTRRVAFDFTGDQSRFNLTKPIVVPKLSARGLDEAIP